MSFYLSPVNVIPFSQTHPHHSSSHSLSLSLSLSSPLLLTPSFSSSSSSWKRRHYSKLPNSRTLPLFHPRSFPSLLKVSLQESSSITTTTATNVPALTSLSSEPQSPPGNQNPSPPPQPIKNSVWVNPNSPRAARLRQQSSDSRYARLAKIAADLDACGRDPAAISSALRGGNPTSEQDAVIVLNSMADPGNALLALRWFQDNIEIKKEAILYNVTFKVLRKSKDWDGVERLWAEMLDGGVKPDNVTFSTVISCARLCNLPEKAVEWFEKMSESGCTPDDVTYSVMIDAYGRSGNVEMALLLYDRARTEKWSLDPVTFTTVIRVHSNDGNFDGALNVYEEMKALGTKPNLVLYNTLLDAMGRAGRPWQVKIIFKEMSSKGLVPNRATLAALLRAYSKARYAEDALNVYREMKAKGMELNVILYNMLLSMCADIGYIDEAVAIFEEMKSASTQCRPDSWSYSSLITAYSCSGKVLEAEALLDEMLEAGNQPNIFVLTSLIQCYGKNGRTDSVVRAFNKLLESGIAPDDRFCGCLLNVATQTANEELGKIIECIERANVRLGSMVKMLVGEETRVETIRQEAEELFGIVSNEVKKAYWNCLIDLCVNHGQMERACVLLDLALRLEIYTDLQSRSPTQWSLHVKSLSLGAGLTALHVWMNDLSKALQNGEELPPLLGINTGHGKHKYSDKGLAAVFESHLRELNAPFHEAPDKAGWFLTTKVAATSWLESRNSSELVAA